ncbi:hypothetical protein [Dactylosporangium darangshiense]|uniref:hypothetical protein n=1 Tax=Dactylosporangium darangshiense TaxID=579108 RepID=UPI003629F4C6
MPVGAVPLLLLAYLVLYLAVDYGVEGRRPELAVFALRGGAWWNRWLLALGESFAAIAAGALGGCVAGQLAVGAIAAWRFPGLGVPLFDADALRLAPATALGALAVALLAQRRHLFSPVAELLRRVRSRVPGRRAPVGEILIGVLAAAALAQLFLGGGRLTGVAMAAPALSIIALAVAVARLVAPSAGALGRAALRRGRLGVALAALQLARRSGPRRLVLLLVASVAVLGYAVAGADVATRTGTSPPGSAPGRTASSRSCRSPASTCCARCARSTRTGASRWPSNTSRPARRASPPSSPSTPAPGGSVASWTGCRSTAASTPDGSPHCCTRPRPTRSSCPARTCGSTSTSPTCARTCRSASPWCSPRAPAAAP